MDYFFHCATSFLLAALALQRRPRPSNSLLDAIHTSMGLPRATTRWNISLYGGGLGSRASLPQCRHAPSTRDRKGPAVPFTRCDRGHREQPGDHACVAARLRIRPAQGPRRGTGGRLEKRETPPAVVDEEDDRVELKVERLGLSGGVSRQQLLLVVPEDVGQAGWQGAWWRVDSFVYR